MQLKLSPFPKRPEGKVAATLLNSQGEEQAHVEQKDSGKFDRPETSSPTAKLAVTCPKID
jgi:hypothetical protein